LRRLRTLRTEDLHGGRRIEALADRNPFSKGGGA
jgi:hypothetical protein